MLHIRTKIEKFLGDDPECFDNPGLTKIVDHFYQNHEFLITRSEAIRIWRRVSAETDAGWLDVSEHSLKRMDEILD